MAPLVVHPLAVPVSHLRGDSSSTMSMSGIYDRFNTTLKWWPWIQAARSPGRGLDGLRARSRLYRYATFAVLLAVCAFGIDLARILQRPKPEFARLSGDGAITSDNIEKAILAFLETQPRSIVLQRLETGAFTPAPALTLFAGHQAFMGWPAHENLWRGLRADVGLRERQVNGSMRARCRMPCSGCSRTGSTSCCG